MKDEMPCMQRPQTLSDKPWEEYEKAIAAWVPPVEKPEKEDEEAVDEEEGKEEAFDVALEELGLVGDVLRLPLRLSPRLPAALPSQGFDRFVVSKF